MIRILDSKSRTRDDYEVLSGILVSGLQQFCTNDCDNCSAKRVCKSVYSAAGYSLMLAGKHKT